MKYLRQDERQTWLLEDYLAHVASASADWPGDLKDLASLQRLGLNGRGTLHDSGLQSSRIDSGDLRQKHTETNIEIVLLGAYHDRYFRLRYMGVVEYRLDSQGPRDDLLVHEIYREDDFWVHEMLFASDSTVHIRCRSMEFEESM